MSTTFTCPEAPRLTGRIHCRSEPCTPEVRCYFCEDGFEEVDEPENPVAELNLNSGNAAAPLKILGLWKHGDGEPYGELKPEEIPAVMQKILVATNHDATRAPFHVAPVDEGGPGTGQARVISLGTTDEDILERLLRFRDLLGYALKNSFLVRWG